MPSARKLHERMRRTKSGWSADDLDRLYTGFGFEYREGSDHRVYIHPEFPDLIASVGRHGSLAKGYVDYAVKLIDSLLARRGT